jgi:hypothetical protein
MSDDPVLPSATRGASGRSRRRATTGRRWVLGSMAISIPLVVIAIVTGRR